MVSSRSPCFKHNITYFIFLQFTFTDKITAFLCLQYSLECGGQGNQSIFTKLVTFRHRRGTRNGRKI